ncbi:GNAT family N-acetyltransferase [Bordetella sp. FB-8]|uniref:GNAT family N-acetyltransferase n=1 Tax=Bordetella sp. FB-8 TaxID=1159870 RepID=UPI0003802238|nr:GNAT family N-acetyltransferase [Bordetella sp. FB-8]
MTQSTVEPARDAAWAGLVFRPMRQEDLEPAWELSQAVKWPHRLQDWRFALDLGQGEVALDGERLIGVAMNWDFETCVTMGLIIVSATHRGRQIASRLVADLLAASTAPTALLHATPDGAGVYARQGFETVITICQHQGASVAVSAPVSAGCVLRPATLADLDTLHTLDFRASGMSRRAALRALLDVGKGVIAECGGVPVGFSFLRDFGRGELIGPVVASDTGLAKALIAHWLAIRAGAFIRLDTPFEEELGHWLVASGLLKVDTVTRMVRGPGLAQDAQMRAYGLITQAMA